jgi:hypothetical protein
VRFFEDAALYHVEDEAAKNTLALEVATAPESVVFPSGHHALQRADHMTASTPRYAKGPDESLTAVRAPEGVGVLSRMVGVCGSLMLVTACATLPASVPLIPEERTTLHVGQIGAIHIPSNQRYSVGSAQSALMPLRQLRQRGEVVYLYRAVSADNDTFVLTPVGIPNGQCISCVTVHYFVTVEP